MMWFRLLVLRGLQRIFGEENVRLTTDEDRAMHAFQKEASRRRHENPNPPTLDLALEQLRDYCIPYFYRDFPGVAIRKEFWTIENDELLYQVLGFLHHFVSKEHFAGRDIPLGFRLALPIMEIEEGYLTDGWTAISNAGDDVLRQAIHAYRTIGMESEALALEAVHRAYTNDPGDEDRWEAAYNSVPNPYRDDDKKRDALRAYFAANRHLFVSPPSP